MVGRKLTCAAGTRLIRHLMLMVVQLVEREIVDLQVVGSCPTHQPNLPSPNLVRAAPSHGEGSAFESPGKDQFDSDWRSW